MKKSKQLKLSFGVQNSGSSENNAGKMEIPRYIFGF